MLMDVYPVGPYGLDELQIINDMTFMGFRDGADPFTQLSMSDYYDPDGAKGIKALYITFGWNGCGACLIEAGNMNKWEAQYRSRGLRQLSALRGDLQTQNGHGPATESTAQAWIKKYGITYDVVIDPTYQLNDGTMPTFDPHSWIIDAKTMQIAHAIPGAPGSLLPWGLTALLQ
jgi:hypothetical protein